jgi:tight adherence protein B
MKWLWVAAFFVGFASLSYMALPGRRVSKKRLGIEREQLSLSKSMDAFLDRRGKRQALAHALNLAGIETEPGLIALRIVLASLVLAALGLFVGPVFALIGLVAPVIVAHMVVKSKGRKRQEDFAAQLPDVLQLLIASLRSGHSLPQAFDALVLEAEEPARSEFDRMLAETRIGVEFHTAMRATARRMASTDLEWIASAVELNRDAGGNLAEVLSNVNDTVRGRFRLRRQIKTLTAEGRISVKVLTGLPIAIFIGRSIIDGEFRDVMFHGFGVLLLAYGAVSLTIGWLVVSRMIRVKGVS